jgi:hypothetical protein
MTRPAYSFAQVARGLAVLLVSLGALLAASCLVFRGGDARSAVTAVAWVAATTSLRVDDEVKLDSRRVGRVAALDAPATAVSLSVGRARPLEPPAVITLVAGAGRTDLGPGLGARLDATARLVVFTGSDSVVLDRLVGSRWQLVSAPAGVELNGEPARGDAEWRARHPVAPGAELAAGGYTIRPGPFRRAVRVTVALDTADIARYLEDSGRRAVVGPDLLRALGLGAQLTLGGGLGLTQVAIGLQLAPLGPAEPWPARPTLEIAVREGGGLDDALAALGYLTSPAALNAEPANRLELVVANLNRTLAGAGLASTAIAGLAARLDTLTRRDGWALDATVGRPSRERLAAALDTLTDDVRAEGTVAGALGFTPRLDRIAESFERLETRIGDKVDPIAARAESILGRVEHEARSTDSVSVVDHLKQNVDQVGRNLAATGRKVATPVEIAAGVGILAFTLTVILRVIQIFGQ